MKLPVTSISVCLLLVSSPIAVISQQHGSSDPRTVKNPYFAKAIQLAETNSLQQLRGAYDADVEDWESTLKLPPFTNCVIDKDTDEGATIYALTCIKRVDSDEEGAAFADVIEAGVLAHPGITKTTARDSANRHSQSFISSGGALIAVRRPINNKTKHLVAISIQPPVKN